MTNALPCQHYWQIAPANGSESSVGVCQLCGEAKVFKNSYNAEDIADNLGNRNREQARRRHRREEEEHSVS